MKIKDESWGWIVPLILTIAIGIAFLTGCWPDRADAAEVSPSPAPTDGVERAIGINVAGIIGAAIFVGIMILVAIRNMKKHSD